jgi:glycerol-3-phosphate dehydrogenase
MTKPLRVAVIGAGINGICIGWELAQAGHAVTVFEKDQAMAHTSSASSKLLHGGLRYLENGEFRLVRESLLERRAWFEAAPTLAKPLRLTLPIYRQGQRGKWLYALGLTLYDALARGSQLPRHNWLNREQTIEQDPWLNSAGLIGAYQFWDGQMDDRQLGLWALQQAGLAGLRLREHQPVARLDNQGNLLLQNGNRHCFDYIINAAGPWAHQLLMRSAIPTQHALDLIRGSHLVLDRPTHAAYLLEVPSDRRIFFVLPWQGHTLVGTTEVRQAEPEPAEPYSGEIAYLLDAYNAYFQPQATKADILATFAALRPLIKSAANPGKATREYALERNEWLITVFGGKWTTARALARKVRHLME